jgi:hypothetical protein
MPAINLQTPQNYALSSFYTTATPEEIGLALELGAGAVQHLAAKTVETVRRQTHGEITDAYESRIRRLQREFEAERKELEAAVSRLEGGARKDRDAAKQEIRDTMRELLEAKEAQVRSLESALATLGNKFESLQNSLMRTTTSSKEKGTLGEIIIEGLLKKAYDCDVEVVSKEAQTADIRVTRGSGQTYFWEVKNYTRMVSKEEVEKFRRDLRLHPNIRGGVLVSLRTGVAGKTRGADIDVEFLEDGRPILFLSNLLAREDVVFYLQTLRPFFEYVERGRPAEAAAQAPAQTDAGLAAALEAAAHRATLVTNLLRNHTANVQKHRNALVTHKKRMDAMFSEFQAYLLEADTQLTTILRLSVGEADATAAAAADSELSLSVFIKAHLTDYAEKEREFVTWFLSVAEVRDGSDVTVKELLERAAEHKKSWNEKFVRGMRSTVFQESTWGHGARVLHGVAWLPTV